MYYQNSKQDTTCCVNTPSEKAGYIDPICGMALDGTKPELSTTHAGVAYSFCSRHCQRLFAKHKEDIISGRGLKSKKNRALPIGLLGTASLIILFLTVVVLANETVGFALSEIQRLWYWVLLLSTGFGLQLGLFIHIRHTLHQRMVGATAEIAASGAVSTGSMIACCSHGLVNLLPIFGISAAAAFLARYQLPFILFGIFSNLIGVTIMFGLAQKNKILFGNQLMLTIAKLNMKLVRFFLIITGVIAIGISIASS
jgi:YHS domain-containing protein